MKEDNTALHDINMDSRLHDKHLSSTSVKSGWGGGPLSARTIRRAQKALARRAAKKVRRR